MVELWYVQECNIVHWLFYRMLKKFEKLVLCKLKQHCRVCHVHRHVASRTYTQIHIQLWSVFFKFNFNLNKTIKVKKKLAYNGTIFERTGNRKITHDWEYINKDENHNLNWIYEMKDFERHEESVLENDRSGVVGKEREGKKGEKKK